MDYYLEDIARLEGQPKRAIADYVEQNGILVPRRFGSLQEARASGLPIIARSEHPQDYAGASGILESPLLFNEPYGNIQSEEELKQKAMAEPERGKSMHKQLCGFAGYNEQRFRQEVSFSFWEHMNGFNRAVIADSAIEGLYHIFTSGTIGTETFASYVLMEKDKILKEFSMPQNDESQQGLSTLVEAYEKIRHLGKFDANHCPIMEFQTVDNKDYFLQYHRTRNFEPASFVLEREPVEDEIELPFVRGATPPEGVRYKVVVYNGGALDWNFNPEDADGSWDLHYCHAFSESMVRNRKILLVELGARRPLFALIQNAMGHDDKSKLFKPQMSAMAKLHDLFLDGEAKDSFSDVFSEVFSDPVRNRNSYMTLDIVSDGRRCFVKRLE